MFSFAAPARSLSKGRSLAILLVALVTGGMLAAALAQPAAAVVDTPGTFTITVNDHSGGVDDADITLYHLNVSNGNWEEWGSGSTGSDGVLTSSIPGLVPGDKYAAYIDASDSSSDSGASGYLMQTGEELSSDFYTADPPAADTFFTATSGSNSYIAFLDAGSTVDGTISADGSPSTDADEVTAYRQTVGTNGQASWVPYKSVSVSTSIASSYTINGLSGGNYVLEVQQDANAGLAQFAFNGGATNLDNATPFAVSWSADPLEEDLQFIDAATIDGSVGLSPSLPLDEDSDSQVQVDAVPLDSNSDTIPTDQPYSTTTNASGGYSLPVAPGNYKLQFYPLSNASVAGYFPQWYQGAPDPDNAQVVSVGAGDTFEADDTLGQGFSITGTVTSDTLGGVGGITVTATDGVDTPVTATTAPDGTYTIPNLPPGTYSVAFSDATGFYPEEFYTGIQYGSPNQSKALPITQSDGSVEVDFDYATYASLEVKVSNKAGTALGSVNVDAEPMTDGTQNLTVPVVGATAVSGHPGTYLVQGLLQGQDYALYFGPFGSSLTGTYAQYLGGSDLQTSAQLFEPEQALNSLSVTLQANSSLSGVVTTTANKPLKNVVVFLKFFDGSSWVTPADNSVALTSATGAYSFGNLPTGSYTVDFNTIDSRTTGISNYAGMFAGGASTADQATAVYITPGHPAVLSGTLSVGGTLSGTIAAITTGGTKLANVEVTPVALTGDPVGGFTAATPSGLQESTSASGGKFTITGLASGYYALSYNDETSTYADTYDNPVVDPSTPVYLVTAAKPTVIPDTIVLPLRSSVITAQVSGSVDTEDVGDVPLGYADGSINFTNTGGTSVNVGINSDGTFSATLAPGDYTWSANVTDDNNPSAIYAVTTGSISLGPGNGNPTVSIVLEPYSPLAFADPGDMTVTGGSDEVGTVYDVVNDQSNRDGVDPTYQWFRGETPIYGATNATYTSQSGDFSQKISVRVTLTDQTYGFNESVVSYLTATESATQSDQLVNTDAPTISDDLGHVGVPLYANPGEWNGIAGVTFFDTWSYDSDGDPIGFGTTYTPTISDVGQIIDLTVTAIKTGYISSDPVPASGNTFVVSVAAPVVKVAPKLTSKVVSGVTTYTVTPGTWSVAGTSPHYQWAEDGTNVGTDSKSFAFNPLTDGATTGLTVVVTASKTGYADGQSIPLVARKDSSAIGASVAPGVLDSVTSAVVPLSTSSVTYGSVLTAETTGLDYASDGTVPTTFSYQWERQTGATWAKISGATHASYAVAIADISHPLQVIISASSATHAVEPWTSFAGIGAPRTDLVDSPAMVNPVATNTYAPLTKVGVTLTTWGTTSSVTDSYQWYYCAQANSCADVSDVASNSNYVAIGGAHSSSYTPPITEANGTLVVVVVGSKSGYVSSTIHSIGLQIGPGEIIDTVTAPAITAGLVNGHPEVGVKLTGKPGTFDVSGVTVHYQWQVSTDASTWTPANGTNGLTTYTPVAADAVGGDQLIRFEETVTKVPYAELDASGVIYTLVGGVPVPTVKPVIATTLSQWSVSPGTWSPVGGTVSYQWITNNQANAGTTSTFDRTTVAATDAVSVVVTYAGAPGYQAGHYTIIVQKGSAPAPEVSPISGTASYGNTLTAPGAAVDTFEYPIGAQPDATIAYQWYSGTTAIAKATDQSFTPSTAYINKVISVKVTTTSAYYATSVDTLSAGTFAIGDAQHGSPALSYSGATVHPGSVLSVQLGIYPIDGLTHGYQWQTQVGSGSWTNISGATKPTYTVLAGNLGENIRAIVTSSKAGYSTASDLTDVQNIVEATQLQDITAPFLTSPSSALAAQAGSVLTVAPGLWNVTGTTYSYEWLRDGILIPGATGTGYTLTGDEYGENIQVQVTAHAAGYDPVSITTNAVEVTLGTPPSVTSVPKIVGTPTEGVALTATPGVWSLDGLQLTFQWYTVVGVTQAPIDGATDSTFTPTADQLGDQLVVVVTASRYGYSSTGSQSALSASVIAGV